MNVSVVNNKSGSDKGIMEMTSKKEEVRVGFPPVQWIALMITVIGMGTSTLMYVTSIKERVSLVEQAQAGTRDNQNRIEGQLAALQKIVQDGMSMRIQLQADTKNMSEQLKRIEEMLQKHISKEDFTASTTAP